MSTKSKKLAVVQTSPLAVIQPPPTKTEILDAMVELQIQRNLKAKAENEAKVKSLTNEAEALFRRHFLSKVKTFELNFHLPDN